MGRLFRGSVGGAPIAQKFCIMWQKLRNFRPILLKINALDRGINISSAKT